jgi:ParB family chromosome partitioning protein
VSGNKEKRGLGRGLTALMADIEPAPQAEASVEAQTRRADMMVPIERVQPNPNQPRRAFAQEALDELATSIRSRGIIQPLIVRPNPDDAAQFQIVAGERRWRAAQIAQLHEVPVIVRNFDDTEVLEVAIIENIQRSDLNPIEEAAGYRQLMDAFGHTQGRLAEAMGKSRSHIANLMRLLHLPDDVQQFLRDGVLSAGHARALITTSDPSGLAKEAIRRGLSVREVERLAKAPVRAASPRSAPQKLEKDADTKALEADLSAATGTKVFIDHDVDKGAGRVSLAYGDLGQLDDIIRILSGGRA